MQFYFLCSFSENNASQGAEEAEAEADVTGGQTARQVGSSN